MNNPVKQSIDLHQKTIPTAQKELSLKSKKKKKYLFFKFISASLFIVLGVILLALTYLYFVRVKRIVDTKEVINTIIDNSITKEEAEAKNLAQVNKNPIEISNLKFSSVLTKSQAYPFINTESASILSLEIDKYGLITRLIENDQNKFIDIFFITQTNRDESKLSTEQLGQMIATYIKENDLKNFELDISLTYLSEYKELLTEIRLNLVGYEYNIGIFLYPKWGDYIDYFGYETISNDFAKSVRLKELSSLVSYIKVMAYDYTGPLDILPGSITPTKWFEKIIQYFISSEVPREKIIMGINTGAYEWPERAFAYNIVDNYSVLASEANVIVRVEFMEFIEGATIKAETNEMITENIYKYIKENKSYITLMPSNEQIEKLVEISAEYGINGNYYK